MLRLLCAPGLAGVVSWAIAATVVISSLGFPLGVAVYIKLGNPIHMYWAYIGMCTWGCRCGELG